MFVNIVVKWIMVFKATFKNSSVISWPLYSVISGTNSGSLHIIEPVPSVRFLNH